MHETQRLEMEEQKNLRMKPFDNSNLLVSFNQWWAGTRLEPWYIDQYLLWYQRTDQPCTGIYLART